jgi:hypothetical protein
LFPFIVILSPGLPIVGLISVITGFRRTCFPIVVVRQINKKIDIKRVKNLTIGERFNNSLNAEKNFNLFAYI